ncbi:unnamed protein product [Somion occarium]|uniref:Fungal lipase-type domain-containing protein n=1 Tax=Somion occarium TaxID=3059160 RepID=A0ABP1E3T7_9APHY
MLRFITFLSAVSLFSFAAPVPTPLFGIHFGAGTSSDAKPTTLSQATISSQLLRPALFSRVAYCSAPSVTALNCGAPCDAVKGISVVTAGGDDGEIPGFFIATDPSTQSVVVAHQGTEPDNILSIANDVQFAQVKMNSTLFPSAAEGVLVHDGFHKTQGRTADIVLSAVKNSLNSTGFKRVLVTGHSLGAAVATLDGVMLRMNLPSDVTVDAVGFGLPRVGNQEFADMVDQLFPTFTHVTNQKDPVPIVPPRFLSYQHASGEVHITAVDDKSGEATILECPGQENELFGYD